MWSFVLRRTEEWLIMQGSLQVGREPTTMIQFIIRDQAWLSVPDRKPHCIDVRFKLFKTKASLVKETVNFLTCYQKKKKKKKAILFLPEKCDVTHIESWHRPCSTSVLLSRCVDDDSLYVSYHSMTSAIPVWLADFDLLSKPYCTYPKLKTKVSKKFQKTIEQDLWEFDFNN